MTPDHRPTFGPSLLDVQKERHNCDHALGTGFRPRIDRLKGYGLSLATLTGKYAVHQSSAHLVIDIMIAAAGAANVLNQNLGQTEIQIPYPATFPILASAVGNFADACEKVDHLEAFRTQALLSNAEIVGWCLGAASQMPSLDLLVDTIRALRAMSTGDTAYLSPMRIG